MKIYRNIIVCAAFVLATGLSLVRAESTETEDQPSEQSAPLGVRQGNRLAQLTEKLSLTDAQREQVAAVLRETQQVRQTIRKDTASPEDVKKAQRRELIMSERAKIRSLLTAEQQASFDQMHKRRGPKASD